MTTGQQTNLKTSQNETLDVLLEEPYIVKLRESSILVFYY